MHDNEAINVVRLTKQFSRIIDFQQAKKETGFFF